MLRLFGLPTLILFELSLAFEASSHARFFHPCRLTQKTSLLFFLFFFMFGKKVKPDKIEAS